MKIDNPVFVVVLVILAAYGSFGAGATYREFVKTSACPQQSKTIIEVKK